MSNMSVNQGNVRPLPQMPEQNVSGTTQTLGQTKTELSESQRRQVFEQHQQLTNSNTNELNHDLPNLEQGLNQTPPKELNENIQNVPAPNQFGEAREQVSRAQTLTIQPLQISDLKLQERSFRDALKTFNFNHVQTAGGDRRNQVIKNHLRHEITPFLKELSKIDKNLLMSKTAKEAALQEVRQKAFGRIREMLQNQGSRDELSLMLRLNTEEQNKALLSELVGEIRDDQPKSFEELSEKKQQFVAALLTGVKEGLYGTRNGTIKPQREGTTQTPTQLAQATTELERHFRSQLEALSPGQLHQLKLKSNQELTAFLSSELGHSELLMPIMISVIRSYVPTPIARETEAFVNPLKLEDLGITESLQSLAQNPGSETVREQVRTALQTRLTGLDPEHNTLWQLGLMKQSELKDLFAQVPGLSQEDQNWLAQSVRAMLPNQCGPLSVNLNGHEVPSELSLNGVTYVAKSYLTTAGFGHVFVYENRDNSDEKVAVKIPKVEEQTNLEALHQDVVNELNLHRELQGSVGHQNIVKLKGVVLGPKPPGSPEGTEGLLYSVQEFETGGSLYQFAQQLNEVRQTNLLSEENRMFIGLALLKQSLEGLEYMHEDRQMLHSDLKSPNLLLGTNGQVKMIDFGTSSLGQERTLTKRLVDNPDFLAPEQMSGGITQATTKSDVWSIGTLGYELLIGKLKTHPFYDQKFEYRKEIALREFSGNPQAKFMDFFPLPEGHVLSEQERQIHDLLNGLLSPLPEQRLSAREALKHPLFQDQRLSSPKTQEMLKKLALPLPGNLTDEQKSQHRFSRVRDDLMTLDMQVPVLPPQS